MSLSPVTLSVLLKSLCESWKRRVMPCWCAVFSLADSEYWHRKILPEVFIAGQYPTGKWQQSCSQVTEKPPNCRFAAEQKSKSLGSTEVAVANFSFVIFLFSLFLTFQRWSFVIYHKPMAVDQGDKNSLRYRTYRLRKCVKNWNDKGGLIACCYWAIVPWLEN